MRWFRRRDHNNDTFGITSTRTSIARSNLLVVRAGDSSLHPTWLAGEGSRNFDILVSYFGNQPDRYREQAEHYHTMHGPRWPAHDVICRNHQGILAAYQHVCFACDDLVAELDTWNRLFTLCRRYDLDLAQPGIEGYTNHDFTRPVEGCVLRYTNFVEIMCPVFSARALRVLCKTFGYSVSGWGLDLLWPRILIEQRAGFLRKKWRIGIVDGVRINHSRAPRDGTLYPHLSSIGVDPMVELEALQARYNLQFSFQEFGRVAVGISRK
jgi:hypothetical protein